MPSARRPTSIAVRSMVQKGITDFERRHPDVVIKQSAKTILLAHAAEHEEDILVHFKSRKETPKDFVKGLQQMLTYAAHAARPGAKLYYLVGSIASERLRTRPTVPRLKEVVISPKYVAIAMKKKCKTFPWC